MTDPEWVPVTPDEESRAQETLTRRFRMESARGHRRRRARLKGTIISAKICGWVIEYVKQDVRQRRHASKDFEGYGGAMPR